MEARFSAPLGRFRDGLFLASDDHNRVLILNPQSGDILEKPLLGGETFSAENPQVSLNNRFVGYKVHAGKVASISVTNGETGLPAASDLKNLRISLWPMMVRPWLCPRSGGLWDSPTAPACELSVLSLCPTTAHRLCGSLSFRRGRWRKRRSF